MLKSLKYHHIIDWWLKFHHDVNNTGYSTSEAPNTNSVRWIYETGGFTYSSPAVVDGRVYIGSDDDNVYCLDSEYGDEIWNFKTGADIRSSPAVVDGRVYIGSYDDNVYCLNAFNGSKIWNYTTGGELYSTPAVAYDKVYICSFSFDKMVYFLDAMNGSKIWSYHTDYGIFSSRAVADDKVYVGSTDSKVFCLDALNGSKIWSYNTYDWVYSSPAVADGKIYIASKNNNVYCFGEKTEPDLFCDGEFNWINVESGETVNGSFFVGNVGEPHSELSWEISEYPEWGTWTFSPSYGTGLTPGLTEGVFVEVVAPVEAREYTGEITIVNTENTSDFCVIPVSLSVVGNIPPTVKIVKPVKGVYLGNKWILPRLIRLTLIIGDITIEVDATDDESGIEKVEFYCGPFGKELIGNSTSAPYKITWQRDRIRLIHIHKIRVVAYDYAGNTACDKIFVKRFL